MGISRAMLRLLRIRELEEEQSRVALESALGEMARLEEALAGTAERDRQGRILVTRSAEDGELSNRLAGIEESHAAKRRSLLLFPRLQSAEEAAVALREDLLRKRVERRQAEALVDEARAEAATEVLRREQQGLDDWFRARNRNVRTAQIEEPSTEASEDPGVTAG